MGFVDDDRKLPSTERFHILLGKKEFLDGADDNALFVVDGLCQRVGVLLVVNGFYQPVLMLKAVDGVLQLAVQHHTVCDNDDRIEDTVVLIVMDCGQPIGDPCNRVRFAGACRMLDQIVFAGTVLLYICQHLPHNIVLMVAGEDHFFFDDDFGHAILHHFFLFLDVGDKAVDQVQQAITLQHFFPQITGAVAIRIDRVACTAADTCTV